MSEPVINNSVLNEAEINEPVINGPSFLGLNKPAYSQSSQSSGNLDYLLEDEEEPKRGWGKLAVIVIALALIGGFGYLRWKQGGFSFLKPTPTAVPAPSSTDSASTSGAAATPDASTPNATPANPAPPQAATPDTANSNPGNPAPAAPDAAAGVAGPSPAAGAPTSGAETNPAPATLPADASAPHNASSENTSPIKPQDNASADKSPSADSEENSDAEPPKPETHTQPADAKPSPARTVRERKPSPVAPMDPIAEAERYIYGRGVGQDCDHGLRLLKPAAAQANPKAMILLGSLYSSGTCTPRDLPTAYRWFALALHKQPDNQPLQDDLQKLWSQMTQPERQLAIKLSQ
jgi:Sel1 repeat-containing protein